MFEDMTCTKTKIQVLFMDVNQTAICLGTQKDSKDVTQFPVEDIERVCPKEPQSDTRNDACLSIVHKDGSTSFKVDTNRSRDILSKRLSMLVTTLTEQRRFGQGIPHVARPTLKIMQSKPSALVSPVTPGVKHCKTPGALGAMHQTKPKMGFRVLEVKPNSEADKLGIKTFDDVIIALDGVALEVPPGKASLHFSQHLKENLECSCMLTLYNDRLNSSRDVTVVPSRKWLSSCFIGIEVRYDPLKTSEVILPV